MHWPLPIATASYCRIDDLTISASGNVRCVLFALHEYRILPAIMAKGNSVSLSHAGAKRLLLNVVLNLRLIQSQVTSLAEPHLSGKGKSQRHRQQRSRGRRWYFSDRSLGPRLELAPEARGSTCRLYGGKRSAYCSIRATESSASSNVRAIPLLHRALPSFHKSRTKPGTCL